MSLRRKAPSNISPSERAFEKYKPRGLLIIFWNFMVFNLEKMMLSVLHKELQYAEYN